MIVLRHCYRSQKAKQQIIRAPSDTDNSANKYIVSTGGGGEGVDVGETSGGAAREADEIEMTTLA